VKPERRLISLEHLKNGITFAMKQNLMIQFVYPDYELPIEYQSVIETIDNVKIMPLENPQSCNANVIVFSIENFTTETIDDYEDKKILVVRTCHCGLDPQSTERDWILKQLKNESVKRINLVLTDIEKITEKDLETYQLFLERLNGELLEQYRTGKSPQINVLTDRILLDKMNNCNAGIENLTLAPNGKFYICPAFYYENENDSVGEVNNGLSISNQQLYKLAYAPLCRKCDAFQCKRCVFLNRKMTKEVNTPSHEQCVTAHLERNASRQLLKDLQILGAYQEKEIKEIDYLDPFDVCDIY
jgi:CXXX repeat peptide maturase